MVHNLTSDSQFAVFEVRQNSIVKHKAAYFNLTFIMSGNWISAFNTEHIVVINKMFSLASFRSCTAEQIYYVCSTNT